MPTLKTKISEIDKKKKEDFKNELKKFKSTRKDTAQDSTDKKVDAVSFYNSLSDEDKAQFNKELEKKKVRESYIAYLRYVYPKYIITPFHALLANICQSVVEKVEQGQKVKILLSVPPQHGKSMTCTETLPSWFIGRNPDLRCIITAYNADVAEKFGDRNRQLVKQHGKDIFGIEISDSQDNKTLWDIKKHQGGLLSAGIMGGLTSNGGALVIVDDPFKNGEEADNPEIREKIYRTFSDSVYTRARGKGNAIIIIHTRWHEDDLIGRLSKMGGWVVVNIPCVWEKGEDKLLHRKIGQTLCPEMGFDADWVETTKRTLGLRKWYALYQGKPYVDGGNMIKRSDLRFYSKQEKPSAFEEITMSCDLSFGGKKSNNDPCCLGVFGRVGANHYLIERIKKKLSFTETLDAIRMLCAKYPQMKKKIIERKANGQATVEVLNREIGGFVEFDPGAKSKVERFSLITPYIESGNLYLPNEDLCPNIEEDVDELLRFPNATHDDFVDIISQYLLNYEYKYGGRINTNSVYSTLANAIRGLKV